MYLQMLIIKYSAINNNGLFNENIVWQFIELLMVA